MAVAVAVAVVTGGYFTYSYSYGQFFCTCPRPYYGVSCESVALDTSLGTNSNKTVIFDTSNKVVTTAGTITWTLQPAEKAYVLWPFFPAYPVIAGSGVYADLEVHFKGNCPRVNISHM